MRNIRKYRFKKKSVLKFPYFWIWKILFIFLHIGLPMLEWMKPDVPFYNISMYLYNKISYLEYIQSEPKPMIHNIDGICINCTCETFKCRIWLSQEFTSSGIHGILDDLHRNPHKQKPRKFTKNFNISWSLSMYTKISKTQKKSLWNLSEFPDVSFSFPKYEYFGIFCTIFWLKFQCYLGSFWMKTLRTQGGILWVEGWR